MAYIDPSAADLVRKSREQTLQAAKPPAFPSVPNVSQTAQAIAPKATTPVASIRQTDPAVARYTTPQAVGSSVQLPPGFALDAQTRQILRLPAGYGINSQGQIEKGARSGTSVQTGAMRYDEYGKPIGRKDEGFATDLPAFAFDTESARRGVREEYSPFYQERLKDYLDQFTKGRSRVEEDTNRALAELQEDEAARATKEGKEAEEDLMALDEDFARRGLFYSGARAKKRTTYEDARRTREEAIARALNRRKGDLARGKERALFDTDAQRAQFERDLRREEEQAVEQATLARRQEALARYLEGLSAAYGPAITQQLAGLY